jgi:hypothetical protein
VTGGCSEARVFHRSLAMAGLTRPISLDPYLDNLVALEVSAVTDFLSVTASHQPASCRKVPS